MASYFLSKTFWEAGHSVRVATNDCGPSTALIDLEAEISVHAFDIEGNTLSRSGYAGEVDRYLNFLRDYSPDIVFLQCWHTWYADLSMSLKREIGFRCIMISHGYVHHMIERPWIPPFGVRRWWKRRRLVKNLPCEMRNLDHIVFLSEHADRSRFFDVRLARKLGIKHVSVIPNSVLIDSKPSGEKFRDNYNIGSRVMFFCPANYSLRKNQKFALKCFLKAAIPNSVLVFAGSALGDYGSELKSIWEISKSDGRLAEVIFLEKLPREVVLDAFDACDIVILTAYAETQPIALLESMAFGKPFLSTDVGCVSDFSGGLVRNTKGGFVKAIKMLAGDLLVRQTLGVKGRREFEERYSQPSVKSKWLDLLRDLAARDSDISSFKSEVIDTSHE